MISNNDFRLCQRRRLLLIHIQTSLIPFLLLSSAIFAAGEAALLSMSRVQLEELRTLRPTIYRKIYRLICAPDALLSTLIISNETLNILLGTAIATTIQNLTPTGYERLGIVVSVSLTTFLLLTVSEILPKVLAFRMPVVTASILVFPIGGAHWLVTPLRKVFLKLSSGILKSFGIRAAPPAPVNEQDFLTLVELGAETGSLDGEEKDLIVNVFRFSDRTVQSVMTPWDKVLSIQDNMTVSGVIERLRNRYFSRIPVQSAESGAVLGVLYSKELLKLISLPNELIGGHAVRNAILPPYVISKQQKVATIFRIFQQKKIHFALVVDEYGKQLGIVTLDDVLNALFQTRKRAGVSVA